MLATVLRKVSAIALFGAAITLALVTQNAYAATEDFKLVAIDATADDEAGNGVAIDGDTVVVGAPRDDINGFTDVGSAYVYVRHGAGWALQAKLTADDGQQDDFFGRSVSISGDSIIVGAHLDDDGGSASGSAYVFVRVNDVWAQQAKIVAPIPDVSDFFGRSVSINGNTALIGCHGDDDIGSSSGAVFVFVRVGSTWFEEEKIIGDDTAAGDQFGWVVSLSNGTGIVGVPNDFGVGVNSGSAYIFIDNGSTWSQQAKLLPSDPAAGDFFGLSVSISENTVIIGADGDDAVGTNAGAAYFFTRSGVTWSSEQKVTASDSEDFIAFGTAVAISGDQAIVGVFSDNDNGNFSGSAYLFSRIGGNWSEDDKLLASNGFISDQFGYSVAMTDTTVIAGAIGTDNGGASSGSAYVFDLVPPVIPEDPSIHDADQDGDNVISLADLLRVIQFFNILGYNYCPEAGTEDGFCPGL